MQEEINEKYISLSVRTSKMTASVLKTAMLKFLAQVNKKVHKTEGQPGRSDGDVQPRGKQSLKELMDQKHELRNIQITDGNIKSFNRVARKYGIDYSLKKDITLDPPRYLVFFKAKDIDVMTAAFKEYAGVSLKKTNKVSIRKKLALAKERVAKHRELQKTKNKERGPEL